MECFYLYLAYLPLPSFLLLLVHAEDHLLVLLEGVPQVDDLALLLPQHLLQVTHCTVCRTRGLVIFFASVFEERLMLRGVDVALPGAVRSLQPDVDVVVVVDVVGV